MIYKILKKILLLLNLNILTFFLIFCSLAQANQSNEIPESQIVRDQDWLTRQQQNKIDQEKITKDQENLKKNYQLKKGDEADNSQLKIEGKETKCFALKDIKINGAKLLSTKDRNKILAKYLDKCFDKKIALEITKDIEQFYHHLGYVAVQVYIPIQNIQNNQLNVEVVEGRVSKIIIDNDDWRNRLQKFTAFGTSEGKVLNINNLNQGLYQINRLASNRSIMRLEPDSKAGQTKVIINKNSKFPLRASIGHDNLGSEFTGVKRTNFSLNADNLLSINDSLSIGHSKNLNDNNSNKDLKIYSLNFSAPYYFNNFGYDFSRSEFLGTSYGNNSIIKISGFSNRHSFNFERLVYNQQSLRLSLFSNLVLKSSASYVNNVKLINSQRKLSILNLGIIYSDNFAKKYNLYIKPTFIKGLGIMNANRDLSSSIASPKARFEALKLYVNVMAKFGLKNFKNPLIIASEFDSQYARNTLFGSEQMAIGGYYSVRGFRENYLIGDHGYFVRNKINLALNDFLDLVSFNNDYLKLSYFNNFKLEPFYDYGWVRNYYNSNSGRLSGVGIKTIFNSKYFNASLTYSQGLNKSKRLNSLKKEDQLIFFELNAGI
jgi:hemolysin activation/secretion protein